MVKNNSKDNLLERLLNALINEWGYDSVRECLETLNMSKDSQSRDVAPYEQRRSRKKTEKPTASTLASKISVLPEQKRLIQILAERYDAKLFLPTAGDIRYFFEMHGEVPPSSKQRIDNFRKILKLLSTLQESTLRQIIEDDAHSGPVQLGPLSDAMRNAGSQRLGDCDSMPAQIHERGGEGETDPLSDSPTAANSVDSKSRESDQQHRN